MTDEIKLTIDGQAVSAPKGTMVVDAAKKVGIEIPVFCYHEKLGPFGCCRMCLVEVEKMPKLVTACTQAVAPDMVVLTQTPKVEKARKGVLEFTLLNHPLDCPVCDKGGECPLQNNTFRYGPGTTRMEFDRAHNAKATSLSPVITIDRERCIACQRCTRYSDIIEQERALVMLNRGFHNDVGTFDNRPYDTRFSGNVIDICPVGALTNSDFRFKARTWDLKNSDTLCAHCGCNCNMTMGTRLNKFMRIETRPNNAVDDGWICDKARWGYKFAHSETRILDASTVSGGARKVLPVREAAAGVAEALKKIADEHGPGSVGFLGSPYGSNEDLYLYQKFFRQRLKTNNIDHKAYPETPGLPVEHYDLSRLEDTNLVLLIASDPPEELPIVELRIKKAITRKRVKLAILNDQTTDLDRFAALSVRYNVGADGAALAALAGGLAKELDVDAGLGDAAASAPTGIPADKMKELVELVRTSMRICVVYNPAALTGDSNRILKRLLEVISKIPTIECGAIPAAPYTNAVGALDMGVLPDYYPGGVPLSEAEAIRENFGEESPLDPGLSALEMIRKAESGELKALLVYRSNPVLDFPGGKRIEEALKKLDLLVVHDMIETETSRLAHIVLPSNGPAYDEGTTTNIGGRVQYRRRGLTTQNPPDWQIVSGMCAALGDETDYSSLFGVTREIAEKVESYAGIDKASIKDQGKNRVAPPWNGGPGPQKADASSAPKNGALKLRVADYLFCNDKILDAHSDLKHHFKPSVVHMNRVDAERLGLHEGERVVLSAEPGVVTADVAVSDRCNPGGVIVPRVSDDQGVRSILQGGGVSWVEIRKA
ncbi:MAG: NADH-quinone oxidoreductase, subunit G [Nitrospinae bacterium CG11_big_fil_rev_8_21_14_0_20_56_8]|nr:MAG: NADH-quinone oxidoreductase, subunit G [Nitrospinae bacterium CG11_big_fil_rev_8_21_14_0_20_56_8]